MPAKNLTYDQLAKRLRIPRGTLGRKILEFNAEQKEETAKIKPTIDDHGHRVHRFPEADLHKIAIKLSTQRRPGRPTLKRRSK